MLLSKVVLVWLVFIQWNSVEGYGRGAPDIACSNLAPRHGPNPQTSPAPYTVTPLQANVEPGKIITVTIQASQPGVSFRGFLIEALNPDSPRPSPIGTFTDPPNNAKILTCSPGFQNALTHGESRSKTIVEMKWQAPSDYEGDVLFKCTFVKDYSTFWVQVPAAVRVRVGRSTQEQETNIQPINPTPSYPVSSTTLSTTTATSSVAPTATSRTTQSIATDPWSFPTVSPPPTPSSRSSIYDGCGHTKGCFGIQADCLHQGTCTALVTYVLKGLRYEFELWAPGASSNSYVAVGFSKDDAMGKDSVTECTIVNGRPNVYMSYNVDKYNVRLNEPTSGLNNVETNYRDGNLYCKFTRDSSFTVQNLTFDLREPHYLLLARGPASASGILVHHEKRSTAKAINFAEMDLVEGSQNLLVKIHGAFMVAAWIFAASMGILIARYFRQTWVGKQFLGKDLWFVFHRALMVLTWCLTMAAFVIIFVKVNGWTSVSVSENPHAVIGCITTGLAFIQPIMAYFRPHPGTPNRFLFNWAHWLVGNSAHILGIVCIFLAVGLEAAELPNWMNWILVTYVAFHAFTHLLLSLTQCYFHPDGSRKSTVFAMKDLAPHQSNQSHFYSTQQDKKEDAHGSKFRKVVLGIYIVVIAGLSAAVIGTVVSGPWH